MMSRSVSQTVLVHLVIFIYLTDSLLASSSGAGEPKVRCKEAEKQAWLNIKEELHDKYSLLSSWGKEEEKRECCEWIGVGCDNNSGHVTKLDLSFPTNFGRDHDDWPLEGKIPTSTQLQTRDAAAFMGNPELCGDPLPKRCPDEKDPTISYGATEDGDKDEFITKGFYVSVALGFVVGFWGVCGTLIFNKSWRYAYFKTLNNAGDWLYVIAAVHKGKLLRIIKS